MTMRPIPPRLSSLSKSSEITDPKGTDVQSAGDNPDGMPGGGVGNSGGLGVGAVSPRHGVGCGCHVCCGAADSAAAASSPASRGAAAEPFPYAHLRGRTGYLIVRVAAQYLPDLTRVSADQSLLALAQWHGLYGLREALTVSSVGAASPPSDGVPEVVPEGPTDESAPPFVAPSRPLVINRWLKESRNVGGRAVPSEALHQRIHRAEAATRTTRFPMQHSLLSYWRVDLRSCSHLVDVVFERLMALAEVDWVYHELPALDPSPGSTPGAPLYGDAQSYLDPAPVGIAARWARRRLGASPPEVRCVDLEQQWVLDHRDLSDQHGEPVVGPPWFGANRFAEEAPSPDVDGHHGTAVLAVLAGGSDPGPATGVGGIAEQLTSMAVTSHYVGLYRLQAPGETTYDEIPVHSNGHVAEAIVNALMDGAQAGGHRALGAGDILLLEVQRAYLPTEADAADFDAIRLAAALDVLVVEAAGNGGLDLDAYVDDTGRRPFDRRATDFMDSGAVMVGAAEAALPHRRAAFSNYGTRVECYGWGSDVTTAGYGDFVLHETPQQLYTNTFEGTSSAVPIVAGAAILLLSLFREIHGAQASPPAWRLRQWLANPETGTAQGPGVPGAIGVMPDLQAIMEHPAMALLPSLYLRRSLEAECREPACSSPDVFLWDDPTFGDVAGIDVPRPSRLNPKHAHVRVRNRGAVDADADGWTTHMYVGPQITLLTPEHWVYAGALPAATDPVAAGDLPHLLSSLDVTAICQARRWPWPSLAAWISNDLEGEGAASPGLDPLACRHWDWPSWLEFMDSQALGCRNVHDVYLNAPPGGTGFPFLLTGAPDRELRFDFEIVRRLPQGVRVEFEVSKLLAATLMPRRDWDGGRASFAAPGPGRVSIPIPPQARSRFEALPLKPRQLHNVRFVIRPTPGSSTAQQVRPGHSIALRQLWQGREVGRVTWRLHGVHSDEIREVPQEPKLGLAGVPG